MNIRNQHEEDLIRISKLRLMDDDFMSKVFDDNIEATQLLLNIILEREDIKVLSVNAQQEFKTVIGHSVRFDVFATDEAGKTYDIEIQRADRGATPQRARYNNSVLDTYLLEKGKNYTELNETYVIFITEKDVLGKGLPLYHVERTIKETNELFNDGSHIIFVNGQYTNNTDAIGKLMHDFRCTNASDMHYSELAEKVKYFKETEGGSGTMCKLLEDMRNETAETIARETAINLLKKGIPVETIAECCNLSLEEVEELKKSL